MSSTTRILTSIAIAGSSLLILVPVLIFFRPLTGKPEKRQLPQGVERAFIQGAAGRLELLVAKPKEEKDHTLAPLLLIPGAYGTAGGCYKNWLQCLASRGRTVYALSLRGHGQSDVPSMLVYMPKSAFAEDIGVAVAHIISSHPQSPPPVLVGHSGGGGLSQYALHAGLFSVSALVLVAPVPSSGVNQTLRNWANHDPLLLRRMIKEFGYPKSPISTPALVKCAWFSASFSWPDAQIFFDEMSQNESIALLFSMMTQFADPQRVKDNANGRVCVMSGSDDVLMTPDNMRDLASEYGCRIDIIEGSGHHVMRDTRWLEAATRLEQQLVEWEL